AETGKLLGSEDSGILTLILYNGTSYQTPKTKTYRERRRQPFVKNSFSENRFNIDVSGHNNVDLEKDRYDNLASMLNVSELKKALDSLSQKFNTDQENFTNTVFSRNGINKIVRDGKPYRPSQGHQENRSNKKEKKFTLDSVSFNPETQEIAAYSGDTLQQPQINVLRTVASFVLRDSVTADSTLNLSLQDKKRYTVFYDSIYKQLKSSQ